MSTATREYQQFIAGQWTPSSSGRRFQNTNPADTREIVTDYPHGSREDALSAVEAIERGQNGERYLVGGRNYAYQDVMQTLANVSGIPAPSRKPAPIVLNTVARVMEMMSKFTGKPPAISRAHLKRIRDNFWYTSAKAERELNVRFRPLSETLTDTVQWFRAHGYA